MEYNYEANGVYFLAYSSFPFLSLSLLLLLHLLVLVCRPNTFCHYLSGFEHREEELRQAWPRKG